VTAHDAEKWLDPEARLFRSSAERTAWPTAALLLACGQKNSAEIIVDAIELERCLEPGCRRGECVTPGYLIDPNSNGRARSYALRHAEAPKRWQLRENMNSASSEIPRSSGIASFPASTVSTQESSHFSAERN